jgi:Beta-galactosidase
MAALLVAASAAPAPAALPPGAPYVWIHDVYSVTALGRARRIGVNTIHLDLPEKLSAEALADAHRIAQACNEQGLQVIVGLPTTLSEGYRTALDNPRYVEAVTAYIHDAVSSLEDEPAVIGWATGDHLERYLALSDEAFVEYLTGKYGEVSALNEAWQTKVGSIDGLDLAGAQRLDDALPFGVGMSTVDAADFQADQYRKVMALWAQLVRAASGGKGLLFTGRVTLYRSLPLIPKDYDVIVTSMPPELLEPDWNTHNVQAIDIARRGGRRSVMPCLRVPQPPDTEDLNVDRWDFHDEVYFTNRIHEWMLEAALHGACGVAFEGEPDTLEAVQIQTQLQKGLRWLADQQAFGAEPRGNAAILYEPYADGFSSLKIPVYGYCQNLSAGEPSNLAAALRRGTRFGPVDYLTVEDLTDADLDRYSVILAPLALDLPDNAQEKLAEYVLHGGVLVADIGAGFAQSRSWQALPPRLAGLFGVPGLVEMRSVAGNLTVHQPCPVVPSARVGASTTGSFEGGTPGQRVGAGHYAVGGWAGFLLPDSQTILFGRLSMGLTKDKKPTFAGLVSRIVGPGAAFFATHELWANWFPPHRLFDEFHADLWQRRATVELIGGSFVTSGVELVGSDDGSVALYNPGDLRRAQLALYAAQHRFFQGAVCQFTAALTDEAGMRTGGVLATVDLPRHAVTILRPAPVELRPHVGTSTASLDEYGAQAIRLTVAGLRSAPSGAPGRLAVSRGTPQLVRLTVRSGEYRVTPGSRHTLRVCGPEGEGERELVADNQGRLIADLQVTRTEVEIRQ